MFFGIDVSKNSVDVASSCGILSMNRANPEQAAEKIASYEGPHLVVVEATGGYERPIVEALRRKNIPVSIVNPRRIHHFAEALGQPAKTDSLDAVVMAKFAQVMTPSPTPEPDPTTQKLKDLMTRRAQINGLLTAEKNRLKQAHDDDIINSVEQIIAVLMVQLKELTKKAETLVGNRPVTKALKEIKGVGSICAAGILAFLPELGTYNRKQIAALAGVAPFTRQSGQWVGKSFCSGGRSQVRAFLYMAALVASRHNPDIKAFYTRLRTSGKPAKLAITACMRKILTHINSIARNFITTPKSS